MKKHFYLLFLLVGSQLFAEASLGRELVVAFMPSEINLNPLRSFTSTEAQIYNALYEGLVTYDPATLDPIPGTARSWDVSPDGKTYTFRIREDANYGNGDPVTAADFRNSWLKFLDPEIKAEYSFLYDIIEGAREYRTGENPDPASVAIRELSPKRLQVVLEEPATHFLKILCHHSFVPVHPAMLEQAVWNDLPEIINNGPYVIKERTPGYILLARNPHYWDTPGVKTELIRILFLSDPEETTRRFNDYEIHWVTEGIALDRVLHQDTIIVNPLFATGYFYFSNTRKPWNDGRVRRALALLAPWDLIRSSDYQFIPATTLVPPVPRYPSPEKIEAVNRQEALRLLEEAGYPGGKGLPKVIFRLPEGEGTRRIAALMAAAWKELGIDSEINTHSYPAYFDVLKAGDYTLGTITWIGDFADPLSFLQMWTTSSNLNDGRYSEAEYDALIKKSMGQSGEERYKTLSAAESLILAGAQVLPVSHSPAINLVDLHYIDGWYRNPLDIHPFKYLAFAPYKDLPGVVRYSRPLTR